MNKNLLMLLMLWIWPAAGCGTKEDKGAEAKPSADAPAQSGIVVLPPDSMKLKQIRVDTVKIAELPIAEVTAPGKIEVNPNRVSRVLLPVTGKITSVSVRLGDSVTAGQLLLTVESPDAFNAESGYLQAEAGVTQAKAALVKAQADYDRAADLFAHDAVAKKEVLSAENALTQAKAAQEQAMASKENALHRLEILGLQVGKFGQVVEVRSPIAGKVLEMSVVPGEYRNDTNAALITIADLSTIWVSSDVPESYIRFVQVGEPVEITLLAYPGEKFAGRVTRIADTVDAQTRTVKVRAELVNSQGRFRPEMFARVRHIEGTRKEPVLPVTSVVQGDGHSVVFVELGPGRFQQRVVEIGNRSGDVVPVESGVRAGDRVVVDGAMLLKTE